MVETLLRLYDRHISLAATGVHQGTTGKEFGILMANFSPKPVYIAEGQAVARAVEHPVTLMENTITHGEIFGVLETTNV